MIVWKSRTGMALAGFAVLLVLAAVWLLLAPAAVHARLADDVLRRTGRSLTAEKTRLSLLPEPAVVLSGAKLGSAPGMEGAVLSARTVRLPVSLWGLVTRSFRVTDIALEGAVLNLAIDGKGRTSFANSEATGDAPPETAEPRPNRKPLHIRFSDASLAFSDERSGTRFAASTAQGDFNYNEAGEITAQGTAMVGMEAAAFTVALADLSRLADDGSPFDFTLTGAGGAASFSGRLSTRTRLNLAGQTVVEAADLRRSLKWLGLPVSGTAGLKNFKAEGALSSEGAAFTFTDVALALDGMAARGTAAADFTGARPMVRATLTTDGLDVTPYVMRTGDGPLPTGKGDEHPVAPWSEQFWDAAGLTALDADVTVAARRLTLGELAMGPAELTGTVKDGRLATTVKTEGLAGGTGTISAGLDGTGPLPLFTLDVEVKAAEAREFLGRLLGFDWLKGPLSVTAQLSAQGNSQARLISTLSGTANVALAEGEIVGVDLDELSRSVVTAVAGGWGLDPARVTRLSEAGAHFTLRDGIATSDDIALASEALSIAARGDIDILRRALDLSARPRLVAGGGAVKLPVEVTVSGPWDAPKMSADMAGTLRDLGVDKGDVKKAVKAGKKIIKSITGN